MFSFVQFSKHRPVVPLCLLPTQLYVAAASNLQSLLLENLSLGNLDWLSGIWGFCQRPVASTDCCAGAAKPPKEAATWKKKASQKLQIASKHWFMLPRLANSVEKEDGSVRPEAQICGNSHKWSRRLWKKGAFSKGSLTTPYPSFTRIDRDVINFFASLCWPTVQMKWKWYLSSV